MKGLTCQNWTSYWPHEPNYGMVAYGWYRQDDKIDNMNHNFCRAADPEDPRPWCYTTDPNVRFDYCDCGGQAVVGQPDPK